MNRIRIKSSLIILSIALLLPVKIYSQEDKLLYRQAIQEIKANSPDFAFMHFRKIICAFPQSKYRENCLFAMGEYYFSISDYRDAASSFNKFINDYPKAKAKPFALAYLFKIAKREKNEKLQKELKHAIVSMQQLSLLFRDAKEHKYTSPLSKTYKVTYCIDKVEFHINGKLLTQISY